MPKISRQAQVVNGAPAPIYPSGKYPFFDKIQVWFGHPLPRDRLNWIESQCDEYHDDNRAHEFVPYYRQRLQLVRPKPEALQFLSTINDAFLNYAEVKLELALPGMTEREQAFDFLCQHIVKRWHGDQGIRFVVSDDPDDEGTTRYTGRRAAKNLLVIYVGRPSKETGEVDCVGVEWRLRDRRALARAGLNSVADLITFDHRAFWSQRLLLSAIDRRQLGRLYCRHYLGRRGHKRWLTGGRFRYDIQLRAGSIICNALGSTQAVIDRYGDVRSTLIPIDVRHLLPL
jgi:hypothetical protein